MTVLNSDIRYRLIGQDVSAGSTFTSLGGKISGARTALSSLGGALGGVGGQFAPILNGLTSVGAGLDHMNETGRSTLGTLQGIGIGVAAAGGALLALGASAQQAKAGLDQAFVNAGFAVGDYSKQIDGVTGKMASFGHTAADSDNALAKLVSATQDPQRALHLMGLAADIAARKNMSLTDSSQLLVNALAGNTRAFRSFGINLGSGKLSTQELNGALKELEQRLGGTAQAQADTFSGKLKGLAVEAENLGEKFVGAAPALLAAGSALTIVTSGIELYTVWRGRQAAADTTAAAAQGRLAAAQTANASTATAAAAAQGSLAASEGAATAAAGAEAAALGAVDVAGGAGAVIGAGFGGSIGGGALLTRLLGPAAGAGLAGSLGVAAAGAGAYFGTSELLKHTALGGLASHYVGHDLFGRSDATPSAVLAPRLVGQQDALLQARAAREQHQQQAHEVSLADQQSLDQATASYLSGLTPFTAAAVTPADNRSMRNTIADARQRLADARHALASARNPTVTAPNPAAVASARASLSSAQAALTKAQYLGNPAELTAATDRVTAAQKRLTDAQTAGVGASKSVADAEMKVRDARQSLATATDKYNATKPLGVGDLFKNLHGSVTDQNRVAGAVRELVKKGLNPTAVGQILAVDKNNPGTIENAAQHMTRAYIDRINHDFGKLKVDSRVITAGLTDTKGARAAALANANAYYQALAVRMSGTPTLPGVTTSSGMARSTGQQIHVHHMDVHANDPGKLGRDTANHSRLNALTP